MNNRKVKNTPSEDKPPKIQAPICDRDHGPTFFTPYSFEELSRKIDFFVSRIEDVSEVVKSDFKSLNRKVQILEKFLQEVSEPAHSEKELKRLETLQSQGIYESNSVAFLSGKMSEMSYHALLARKVLKKVSKL